MTGIKEAVSHESSRAQRYRYSPLAPTSSPASCLAAWFRCSDVHCSGFPGQGPHAPVGGEKHHCAIIGRNRRSCRPSALPATPSALPAPLLCHGNSNRRITTINRKIGRSSPKNSVHRFQTLIPFLSFFPGTVESLQMLTRE